jgi:hypothetical protein
MVRKFVGFHLAEGLVQGGQAIGEWKDEARTYPKPEQEARGGFGRGIAPAFGDAIVG